MSQGPEGGDWKITRKQNIQEGAGWSGRDVISPIPLHMHLARCPRFMADWEWQLRLGITPARWMWSLPGNERNNSYLFKKTTWKSHYDDALCHSLMAAHLLLEHSHYSLPLYHAILFFAIFKTQSIYRLYISHNDPFHCDVMIKRSKNSWLTGRPIPIAEWLALYSGSIVTSPHLSDTLIRTEIKRSKTKHHRSD